FKKKIKKEYEERIEAIKEEIEKKAKNKIEKEYEEEIEAIKKKIEKKAKEKIKIIKKNKKEN
ncbi:15353_t:CDS:1, partial [Cetraspora pellucida]